MRNKKGKSKESRTELSGFVKLYARGKLGLLYYGEKKFQDIAGHCFANAIRVALKFDRKKFEAEMLSHGISRGFIKEFADNFSLSEDVWLSTGSNWPN
jgi:hypothetical protein